MSLFDPPVSAAGVRDAILAVMWTGESGEQEALEQVRRLESMGRRERAILLTTASAAATAFCMLLAIGTITGQEPPAPGSTGPEPEIIAFESLDITRPPRGHSGAGGGAPTGRRPVPAVIAPPPGVTEKPSELGAWKGMSHSCLELLAQPYSSSEQLWQTLPQHCTVLELLWACQNRWWSTRDECDGMAARYTGNVQLEGYPRVNTLSRRVAVYVDGHEFATMYPDWLGSSIPLPVGSRLIEFREVRRDSGRTQRIARQQVTIATGTVARVYVDGGKNSK
jgi:hypothetical protein